MAKKRANKGSVKPPRRGRAKTSKAAVENTEKQRKVLELRRAGMTLQEIADKLGYAGPSGPQQVLDRALERMVREPAESVRALETERLDLLWAKVWEALESGNLAAVDSALRVMARRARLLGLDAPTNAIVQVTTFEGMSNEQLNVESAVIMRQDGWICIPPDHPNNERARRLLGGENES